MRVTGVCSSELYKKFDKNRDQYISAEEFEVGLLNRKFQFNQQQIQQIWQNVLSSVESNNAMLSLSQFREILYGREYKDPRPLLARF